MFSRRIVVASLLVLAVNLAVAVRTTTALPLYATRQGLPCATCHFDPQGGGPRNEFGFLYSKQRHELAPDTGRWADLVLSNKIGDALYFGTNLREQYTYVHELGSGETAVSTSFPMQGALYATFAPHEMLTFTFNHDLRQVRDVWGMIHGLPGGFYIKAGQFRVPFGLRIDDHTGAMRAGFLDASSGSFGTSGFLPYDPRGVQGGIEVGATPIAGTLFTAALQNGGEAFQNQMQAVTGKAAYFSSRFIAGLSGYHNWSSSTKIEDTRGSLYAGLNVMPRLQFLAEGGLGTTDDGAGTTRDVQGLYIEGDFRLSRGVLFRAKYDYIDQDHDNPGFASERYTVESDVTLVPFVDVKVSARRVVPEDAADENQFLLQAHVYY